MRSLDACRLALGLGGEDVDHVAAHPVAALGEVELVASVLHVGEAPQQLALVDPLAAHEVQHHAEIRLRVAEAVDRRDRRDDDRVRAFEQRLGGRQPHLLDVGVHRGVLLDVGVGGRDVGLRLVIVVVADEVLDRVVGEELAELAVELGRERLVVRHHQGRALDPVDDVTDGEGLAGPRHSQQRLVRQAARESVDELFDRRGLVARRLVVGAQSKAWLVHRRAGNALGRGARVGLRYALPPAAGIHPWPSSSPSASSASSPPPPSRSPAGSPSSGPKAATSSASAWANPISIPRCTSPTPVSRRSARDSRATRRSRASRNSRTRSSPSSGATTASPMSGSRSSFRPARSRRSTTCSCR